MDTMKLLVVEDEAGDVRDLKEQLKDGGVSADIVVAATVKQAIQRAATGTFDVILLDMGLPDSEALDTVRAMLAVDQAAPIVVVTGLDDPKVGVEAVALGAVDYLVKGRLSADHLAGTIGRAMARRHIQDMVRSQGHGEAGEAILVKYGDRGHNALSAILHGMGGNPSVLATVDQAATALREVLGPRAANTKFVDCCGATTTRRPDSDT